MNIEYKVGDTVRITTGAFAAFTGRVAEVSAGARRLKVEVAVFRRKNLVELGFEDVEKLTFAGNLKK